MGQTVHPTPTASADFSQLCPRVFARNGPGGRPAITQLIDEITTLIR